MKTSDYYRSLKKRLWIGTLVLDLVLLVAVALTVPHLLTHALFGIGLGIFYLWSLFYNAEHPQKKIQLVFSLIRMVFLAYIIVKASNARLPEVTVVMCGLLSYKGILTVEYVVQALPGFRLLRKPKRQPEPESA